MLDQNFDVLGKYFAVKIPQIFASPCSAYNIAFFAPGSIWVEFGGGSERIEVKRLWDNKDKFQMKKAAPKSEAALLCPNCDHFVPKGGTNDNKLTQIVISKV